ncbi:MAG: FISUMP domain-containing protein, partial [Bacteroidales bacterium]
THYANGDPIPHVTDNNEWISLSTGAYCYYDNDKKNAETYGALYNWWAAVDPRGLIVGWHTPSHDEWREMSLAYPSNASEDLRGQKLKEAGTKHWQAPNQGANNQSGFTALPGGSRAHEDGKFYYLKTRTYFQCTTEIGNSFWTRILFFDQNKFDDGMGIKKSSGASIRLIKNN